VRSFAFDTWDQGHLTVNHDFAPLLRSHGLTTFDSIMNFAGGQIAKNLLRERTTVRLELTNADGNAQTLYLKRHTRTPLKEYLKPLLRLTRPIVGARNEWEAILRFHEAGIATMVPVALGEFGAQSFLLTSAIEGCQKLSEWMTSHVRPRTNGQLTTLRQIIEGLADVARTMHSAALHHQDFYLTHLMIPQTGPPRPIRVLDLGRVGRSPSPYLSRRWIVKDLAQLDYSATAATASDRLRFLKRYLGRPIADADRSLIRRIRRKSLAIARHSRKNGL